MMSRERKEPVNEKEIVIGIVLLIVFGAIIFVPGLIQNPEKTWPQLLEALVVAGTLALCVIVFLLVFGLSIWGFSKLVKFFAKQKK
jgi:F0F1-type ATP synthase membrane subunit a